MKSKTLIMKIFYIITIIICIFLIIGFVVKTQREKQTQMDYTQQDTQISKSFEVAIKKAKELDYEVQNMKINLLMANNIMYIYFEPILAAGHSVFGGDIAIEIDMKTQKILNIKRGQ